MDEGGTIEMGDMDINADEVADILATSLNRKVIFTRSADISISPYRQSGTLLVPDSFVLNG